MPKPKSAASKYLDDLVAMFPDAPALTLAKRAYREHPELWANLEACRTAIRRRFGAHGTKNRHRMNNRHYREPRPAGWKPYIPAALTQIADWRALQIDGPLRALVLSDIHIPFHDPTALEVALDYGLRQKPDMVLLNGDGVDHHWGSKFLADPRQKDFPGEVRAMRQLLKGLRKRFPKARLLYKMGNHEERYESYMIMKCPEFLGIEAFEWGNVFGLDEWRIELVRDKRPIRLGKLNVIHGHEYAFQISSPVNPARGFFLRAKAHVLGGHFHQSSEHSEKNVEQKVVSTFSTGCLCGLHPAYRPLNPWNHGFAVVAVDKAGSFRVENLRIVNGKIW